MPASARERVKSYLRRQLSLDQTVGNLGQTLERVAPDVEVILDIGANVGNVTLTLLEMFPKATVYAFEPCSSTFQELSARVGSSPHADRARLFNLGFYSEERQAVLNLTNSNAANSLLPIVDEYRDACPQIDEIATEDVSLVRLDDFVVAHSIDRIGLMKIDVEGAEFEVLSGGRATLAERTDVVLCEISFVRWERSHGRYLDILRVLHEAGFAPAEVYDIAQNQVSEWRLQQMDCVFRRFSEPS